MPHSLHHANLGRMPLEEAKVLILECLDMFDKELKGFLTTPLYKCGQHEGDKAPEVFVERGAPAASYPLPAPLGAPS